MRMMRSVRSQSPLTMTIVLPGDDSSVKLAVGTGGGQKVRSIVNPQTRVVQPRGGRDGLLACLATSRGVNS